MKKILSVLLFVTICVPLTWTIYVPEHIRNHINSNEGDNDLEKMASNQNNLLQSDLQQGVNKYLLNLINNNNDDGVNDDDVERNDVQQSLFTALQVKTTNAHQLLPIPPQQKSYDIEDDVVVSTKKHLGHVYENLEAQPTGLAKQQQHNLNNNDELAEMVEENEFYSSLPHSRQRRQLSDFLIAPNTRWCGRGNTANGTYNHLGGASTADKCCRTHDHCKLYIPAMSNRFDLFNYRPYTLSHCNCDRRFRTCLKMANDEDANTIGKLFFNLVQTQCFVLAKEIVCQQRANDGTCFKEHIKQKAFLKNNKKY